MEKWPQMAQNRAGRILFLLIQTLPTFWAERIWILRLFIFLICWIPNFWISRSPTLKISGFPDLQIPKIPDFQVPRFPDAAAACAGRILRSQPDPSPNARRDQIRRKGPKGLAAMSRVLIGRTNLDLCAILFWYVF